MLIESNWLLENFSLINFLFFVIIASLFCIVFIIAIKNRTSEFQIIDFKEFITEWGKAHQFEGTIEDWVETSFFWGRFLKMNYKIGKGLSSLGFSPNLVTTIGFLLCVIAGWFIILGGITWHSMPPIPIEIIMFTDIKQSYAQAGGYFITGGVLYIFSGLVDGFDGAVARVSKRITKFGSIFDNVMDKYSDLIFFGAIIVVGLCDTIIGFLVIIGFYIMEYARAFGETRGVHKTIVTPGERPIRLICISILFFVLAGHLISLVYYYYIPFSLLNFYLIEIGMIVLVFFTQSSGPILLIYLKIETSKLEKQSI
ncbi:MAG: CDP-alcohol phosphatidyltransferase family protein [Promethearchaeota archaeon]